MKQKLIENGQKLSDNRSKWTNKDLNGSKLDEELTKNDLTGQITDQKWTKNGQSVQFWALFGLLDVQKSNFWLTPDANVAISWFILGRLFAKNPPLVISASLRSQMSLFLVHFWLAPEQRNFILCSLWTTASVNNFIFGAFPPVWMPILVKNEPTNRKWTETNPKVLNATKWSNGSNKNGSEMVPKRLRTDQNGWKPIEQWFKTGSKNRSKRTKADPKWIKMIEIVSKMVRNDPMIQNGSEMFRNGTKQIRNHQE